MKYHLNIYSSKPFQWFKKGLNLNKVWWFKTYSKGLKKGWILTRFDGSKPTPKLQETLELQIFTIDNTPIVLGIHFALSHTSLSQGECVWVPPLLWIIPKPFPLYVVSTLVMSSRLKLWLHHPHPLGGMQHCFIS
jgi:hypothetical protein